MAKEWTIRHNSDTIILIYDNFKYTMHIFHCGRNEEE